jgi:predicted nucleic acid-binding protein
MGQRESDTGLETQKIVADTSVVVKWFIEEAYSSEAKQMRDAFLTGNALISVPSLFYYEVLNVLWHSGLYPEEELLLSARALSKYGFEVYEPRGTVYELSAKLSSKHSISVYDAAYVALALHLEATLYTADAELIRKFPDTSRHISTFTD